MIALESSRQRRGRLVGDEQLGLAGRAMAIITRWRIPPLNSWG